VPLGLRDTLGDDSSIRISDLYSDLPSSNKRDDGRLLLREREARRLVLSGPGVEGGVEKVSVSGERRDLCMEDSWAMLSRHRDFIQIPQIKSSRRQQ
jgi:hypothetical protein